MLSLELFCLFTIDFRHFSCCCDMECREHRFKKDIILIVTVYLLKLLAVLLLRYVRWLQPKNSILESWLSDTDICELLVHVISLFSWEFTFLDNRKNWIYSILVDSVSGLWIAVCLLEKVPFIEISPGLCVRVWFRKIKIKVETTHQKVVRIFFKWLIMSIQNVANISKPLLERCRLYVAIDYFAVCV